MLYSYQQKEGRCGFSEEFPLGKSEGWNGTPASGCSLRIVLLCDEIHYTTVITMAPFSSI